MPPGPKVLAWPTAILNAWLVVRSQAEPGNRTPMDASRLWGIDP